METYQITVRDVTFMLQAEDEEQAFDDTINSLQDIAHDWGQVYAS